MHLGDQMGGVHVAAGHFGQHVVLEFQTLFLPAIEALACTVIDIDPIMLLFHFCPLKKMRRIAKKDRTIPKMTAEIIVSANM